MIFKQYYLGCLAHASYLIGDEETATAVVVDPQRDIHQYIRDAEQQALQIRYVFLTHFHADFLAGHLELRDQTGATICLGVRAEAEYAFRPFGNGDVLDIGQVRLKTLETPGHTPEAISILVYDRQQNADRPHAVLTGDTLFIGDVGRPDLMASIGMTADELANLLYDSLHNKLLPLPDETLVYPAHGAGSLCGRNLSTDTVSTMGTQRHYNYALQPMSREAFVALVTADQPEAPSYFAYDAMLNRRERATLEAALEQGLTPLSLDTVIQLMHTDAQVVDVRDVADFAGAHLRGSLNISLSGAYATWAGTLLDRHRPIVLVADPGQEGEAATRLGRIGFDHVQGFLDGGMQALDARLDLVQRTERITAPALAEQLASATPPVVLDVRTEKEWQDKHIEGSLNIPLNHLRERISEIPLHQPLVVHCGSGYRSAIAVSILTPYDPAHIADLVGGFAAWEASQFETTTSEASTSA
ncbi:MAG: sulfurtransferase [Candidatus Entotheonella factor]|uniref:Sulfurtransferase n=1 Tax=Entotheonella factor TaxID=1429438 RepID=W4LVG7_ENTF1|nr:MAG: sulfurtransferase [Candidatus Entotheonella factor]